MPRRFYEAASFVVESVRRLGFQAQPGSRLMRNQQALCNPNGSGRGFIPPTDPEFEVVLEALRDTQQLELIFDELNADPQADAYKLIVRRLLRDSVLPQDGSAETPGRDAQTELFVSAVCRKSGLHPVEHAEPDVRCWVDGIQFGLAVKRIKSVKKLVARVKRGAEQIHRARLPGIIAVDTCLALNPENRRITRPMADECFARLWSQWLSRRVAAHHSQLQEAVRGKGVRGIILLDNQIRMNPDRSWGLESMTFSIPTARGNQRREREFNLFCGRYCQGLPNLRAL